VRAIQGDWNRPATAAVRCFERFGVPCVNPSSVIATCGDTLTTNLALARRGAPTPRVRVAPELESALRAIEEMGYPVALKPAAGSWGRSPARIDDRDAAERVPEHKATPGSVQHSVFRMQEHVDKPERDLHVLMMGDEPMCVIVRASNHLIT